MLSVGVSADVKSFLAGQLVFLPCPFTERGALGRFCSGTGGCSHQEAFISFSPIYRSSYNLAGASARLVLFLLLAMPPLKLQIFIHAWLNILKSGYEDPLLRCSFSYKIHHVCLGSVVVEC